MTTSSTHLQALTSARRSSSVIIGGPFALEIASDVITPTTKVSHSSFAYLKALKCPECIKSKHPSKYNLLTLSSPLDD